MSPNEHALWILFCGVMLVLGYVLGCIDRRRKRRRIERMARVVHINRMGLRSPRRDTGGLS